MRTVSFQAILIKNDSRESARFFRNNKLKIENELPCDEIRIVPEFNDIYFRISVAVLDASNGCQIGSLDEMSVAKLALLNSTRILGRIISIDNKAIMIGITTDTSLPDLEVDEIVSENAKRIVERYYSDYSKASFAPEPPTFKQFSYAINLGIDPRQKSFFTISEAIDYVLEEGERRSPLQIPCSIRIFIYRLMCSNTSATNEQRKKIRELHGEVYRTLSYYEAVEVIAFLEKNRFKCPYCHRLTANYSHCDRCGKSMAAVKIPIYLDENDKIKSNLYVLIAVILPFVMLLIFLKTCS